MYTTIYKLWPVMLNIHDAAVNATDSPGMTPEMKTFYSKYLIEYATPLLIHDQFGQKHPIPKNGGKTIEFRKKTPFKKAMKPLTEGVVPASETLKWGTLTATVQQYGSYVALTDRLVVEAIDNNIIYATENCSDQAGSTLDTVTREVLNGGTNVQYGENAVTARHLLVGSEADANHVMSVRTVKLAVHNLKAGGAKTINGSYVAIIHPDASFDLTEDPAWIDVKKYSDPTDIYEGEIGKLHGCRFVETLEAKIFHAEDLSAGSRELTVKTAINAATKTVAIAEALTAEEAAALAGRSVLLGDVMATVDSAAAGAANAATLTLKDNVDSIAAATKIYPGEGGAKGRDVYATLFLGKDAYGVTEIDGEGLKHYVKPLGSAGTADPIDQISTVGWKASKTAERLVESFMLRVETASTFESGAN